MHDYELPRRILISEKKTAPGDVIREHSRRYMARAFCHVTFGEALQQGTLGRIVDFPMRAA